ncbi:HYC_CC_PP family protein [Brumimicrobium mesophilum]|uniref:HYC_CC_PP family protein n=1 Tax=Brumimicrobium mesophilum TaxID=392717 RepID=UPI00131B7D67|nr:hypothetical protein [Brumimicrobium mesophilum]
MKQKSNIFLLFLVALFFVSTTGVTIYKHHCSHGGEFYGVYVDVEHGCEPEVIEEVEIAHECCSSGNENTLQVEDDCCDNDVQVYQIDTDLATNDVKIDFINNFALPFSNSVFVSFPEYKNISTSNKAPPSLTTLERLSLFQSYLI